MAYCTNCGRRIRKEYKFCPTCGYRLDGDSGLLYHYTSIETLYAILSGIEHNAPIDATDDRLDYYWFKLRATHYYFLNDPLEYMSPYYRLLSFMQNDKRLSKYQTLLYLFSSAGNSMFGVPYIISLSKNRDSLDMWRSYSNNGVGIAIGFKADSYKQIRYEEDSFNRAELFDCKYVDDDGMRVEFSKRKPSLLKMFSTPNNFIPANDVLELHKFFATFKNPCYINEREARILLFGSSSGAYNTKFRASRDVIIPYREVSLPLTSIEEIVIGPCANKDWNKQSIEMLLQSSTKLRWWPIQMGITINCSELPYRQV